MAAPPHNVVNPVAVVVDAQVGYCQGTGIACHTYPFVGVPVLPAEEFRTDKHRPGMAGGEGVQCAGVGTFLAESELHRVVHHRECGVTHSQYEGAVKQVVFTLDTAEI